MEFFFVFLVFMFPANKIT